VAEELQSQYPPICDWNSSANPLLESTILDQNKNKKRGVAHLAHFIMVEKCIKCAASLSLKNKNKEKKEKQFFYKGETSMVEPGAWLQETRHIEIT